jgi:hydroxymethylpyrimidine pyrophosphatase-like HAD family hydrolase
VARAVQSPRDGASPFGLVVTDLDRTFTREDLALDDGAIAAARRLRQAGVTVVLATGRRVQDLEQWPVLHDAFDGFVLECGALWGPWGALRATSTDTAAVRSAAATLRAEGCQIDEGVASCSVPADWARRLDALPERPRLSVQPNRDRLDVVPFGVDKAAGLRRLLSGLGGPPRRMMAVGDGENDLPVFAMADHGVAVPNAAAVLLQAADEVAPLPAAAGFVWASRRALGEPGPSGP